MTLRKIFKTNSWLKIGHNLSEHHQKLIILLPKGVFLTCKKELLIPTGI